MAHLEFSKEITALLVIDPYNEFISAGPPSIDNRTARIGTEEGSSSLTPESSATRKLSRNGLRGSWSDWYREVGIGEVVKRK